MKKSTTFKLIILFAVIAYIVEVVVIALRSLYGPIELIHFLMSIMYILVWVVVYIACYHYKRQSLVTFSITYCVCGIVLMGFSLLYLVDAIGNSLETFAILSMIFFIPLYGFEYILVNDIVFTCVVIGIYTAFLIVGLILRRKIRSQGDV